MFKLCTNYNLALFPSSEGTARRNPASEDCNFKSFSEQQCKKILANKIATFESLVESKAAFYAFTRLLLYSTMHQIIQTIKITLDQSLMDLEKHLSLFNKTDVVTGLKLE